MKGKIVKKESTETKKSKLQNRYQKLLKDIDKKKKQHQNLTEGLRIAVPRVISELQPLAKEEADWHIKRLVRLDEIVDEIVISKAKKDMFVDYIVEEAETFLSNSHPENEDLQRIFKKYTGDSFDGDELEMPFDSDEENQFFTEDFFERVFEENPFATKANTKSAKKKKPSQREIQEAEEQKILALDAKAIYFRLIKKYHPDRQQDIEKQNEYTEISKLVTKAYKENDFMALLRLQVQYIDENENDAHALADDMIERYNKILKAQLEELNTTIAVEIMNSRGMVNDFFDENYAFSEKLFLKTKKGIEQNIELIKANIEESHKQKKGWFKQWLKELQDLREMAAFDFLFSGFR
jgi:hypothetical protein